MTRCDCLLSIPGRGEARTLTDPCAGCSQAAEPVAVLDVRGHRQAVYRCAGCGYRWLTVWGMPGKVPAP
jgi:hypothetical protein